MIPDSITLALFVGCLICACLAWGYEPRPEEPEPDHDDYETRADEWREDQAIERQGHPA